MDSICEFEHTLLRANQALCLAAAIIDENSTKPDKLSTVSTRRVGWLDGDLKKGLKTGVALAVLSLNQYGDMYVRLPQEVESLIEAPGAAIVQ